MNKHDAVAGRLPVPEHHGENLNEMDSFSGGVGFLELDDLNSPASPSSSSDNSSAMSLSSGECFDAMALLQDLEDPVIEQKDEGKKLNVSASKKLDEVVIVPPTLGMSTVLLCPAHWFSIFFLLHHLRFSYISLETYSCSIS